MAIPKLNRCYFTWHLRFWIVFCLKLGEIIMFREGFAIKQLTIFRITDEANWDS